MWPKTVRKSDLIIKYYRGSGPGGQNKNKRDTACRITHIPTKITVTSETFRTQGENKREAFLKLAKKLKPLMTRKSEYHKPIDNTVIRTYNAKRNKVKDHRTGKEANYDRVLDGDFECLK